MYESEEEFDDKLHSKLIQERQLDDEDDEEDRVNLVIEKCDDDDDKDSDWKNE